MPKWYPDALLASRAAQTSALSVRYLDSGATCHYLNDSRHFLFKHPVKSPTSVKLGDDTTIAIKEIGTA